nr:carboxypeptidase Y [Ipomoea batatas]
MPLVPIDHSEIITTITIDEHNYQYHQHQHYYHHGQDRQQPKPTCYQVYCRADHKYALTIRNNKVTLAPSNPFDPRQHWYKEHKLGTQVKDAIGLPSFALVNKATMETIQHGGAGAQPVQLVKYEANDGVDHSILEGGRDEGVETAATAMETVVFSVCGDGVRFKLKWLRQVEAVAITNVLSKTLGMEITIRSAVIGGAATTMALIATARIRHVTATIAVKRKYL